ncbi:hypothetical protein [Nocardia sp. CA-145437]|uniref:hypothetical protein n=1 Tax=Nocardia sp. CA-145437 TaxID=3239980 RepID=UPI003D979CB1
MLASIARSAAVAALAVPLLTLAAPSASAAEPAAQPAALQNIDAPYISITICLHIPTPGSATLDWCWP